MILSGPEILKQINAGTIRVSPFNPSRINPASLDLTLGNEVAVYRAVTEVPSDGDALGGRGLVPNPQGVIDTAIPQEVRKYVIPEKGWLLKPGIGYLMHTAEAVWTDSYVPVLDGKSSIGRCFTKVHETAGYGDPHFDGQYTLEVTTVHPVIVYAGMRISQIRFHTIEGERALYDGNYIGDLAKGPIPSRVWAQLEKEGLPKKF